VRRGRRDHGRCDRVDAYKIRIGRSLLLGLEVLVAADIVKTIAHELTFMSLGLLAGLVLIRTFLSWTLVCWKSRAGGRGGESRHQEHAVIAQRSLAIAAAYRFKSYLAFPFDDHSADPRCRCGLATAEA